MKQFFVAATTAITLAIASPALAAGLAPPSPADAMYNWSGFYIGANGGGGSSHSCWTIFDVIPLGCHDATGGVAGAQIGYRWQSSAWVLGVEAQGDWAGLEGSNEGLFPLSAFINHSRVNALGLVTAQIGYAADNALFYLKGGAAVTSNHFSSFSTPSPTQLVGDAPDQTRWGTALGVGLEYGFSSNWSLGIEYDHLFMPDQKAALSDVPADAFPATEYNIGQGVDLVTARLNYRFGG